MARDAAKAKAKDTKAKDKEREAERKAKERAVKAKAKEKAAKAERKEKDRAARAKEAERAKKAKAKQREAREKEKAREARAKEKAKERRDAERAARDKEAERAKKAKAKQREAREKEKAREARAKEKARGARAPRSSEDEPQVVQRPVEEVAVDGRGETTEVPAEVREQPQENAAVAELVVPDNDTTVRPKGYLAEALGKEDAVDRSTQRATLAASYTTRDHELIQAWARTRNGVPADVKGTGGRRRGPGTAGVLRIEFPDGPGDDSRLEDVDWAPFFETFDASDVDFLYQERVRTGDVSRFHKFVRTAG